MGSGYEEPGEGCYGLEIQMDSRDQQREEEETLMLCYLDSGPNFFHEIKGFLHSSNSKIGQSNHLMKPHQHSPKLNSLKPHLPHSNTLLSKLHLRHSSQAVSVTSFLTLHFLPSKGHLSPFQSISVS